MKAVDLGSKLLKDYEKSFSRLETIVTVSQDNTEFSDSSITKRHNVDNLFVFKLINALGSLECRPIISLDFFNK